MSTETEYVVRPIGRVHSTLRHRAEAPRQGFEGAPDARIHILPAFLQGLDGIAAGQEILVLTWLHEAERDVLLVHPRDDENRPMRGVFSTRSADRPNPIGVHRVTVLAVEDDGWLHVRPLEAIDGTSVIDIEAIFAGIALE